jgi:hypothetical protein
LVLHSEMEHPEEVSALRLILGADEF